MGTKVPRNVVGLHSTKGAQQRLIALAPKVRNNLAQGNALDQAALARAKP
jgi:hypothetical protein